jgi:hypothetical protein
MLSRDHLPSGCLFARQGSLLDAVTSSGVSRIFKKFFSKSACSATNEFFYPRRMTYGTICSGTEIPTISVRTGITSINAECGPPPAVDGDPAPGLDSDAADNGASANLPADLFTQCFLCEIDDDKRAFAQAVAHAVHGDGEAPGSVSHFCAFKDARTLVNSTSWCSVHNKECPVPKCDGILASCLAPERSCPCAQVVQTHFRLIPNEPKVC